MDEPTDTKLKQSSLSISTVLPWVLLFGVWVLLSGKFDAFHLGMGVLTILGLVWLHRGLEPLSSEDCPPLRMGRFFLYCFWLFKEMIVAALLVAKEILRKDIRIDPQLIHFEAEQPTVTSAVIFGHSITLTPGTITLDLEENRYVVHALTDETARGVIEGSMSQRVAKLYCNDTVSSPRVLPEPEIKHTWN